MPAPANPDVAWAVDDIRANLPRRQRAIDYDEGRHPLNFATDKFRNTFGELFQEFADNLCDDVVNEPTDRLQIDGWSGKAAAKASEWWESQKGAARSGGVHRNGFREGDGFAIVWDDGDDIPRLYLQDPRQMAVRYSSSRPDLVEVAAKCWKVGKGYRLNLYYGPEAPGGGRIEHYFSKGFSTQSGEKGIPNATAFLPYSEGVEGEEGHVPPVEFHDKARNPVFHFPNGEVSRYGRSALADVYPLQDALNKSICDMLVTSESFAQPHRWGTGIEVPKDPVTGEEKSPWKSGDPFWWTKSKDAEFGAFPASDRKGFLEEQRGWRLEIARKGALPAHSVDLGSSGNAPSGLSLLIAEGKLIKRVKDRQRDWGDVWRELVAFALSWNGETVEAKSLELVWAPAETRDEKALLETITLKRAALGSVVPTRQLALEAGYTPEELDDFQELKEQETAEALDRAQAAMGGRLTPPVPGGGGLPSPPVQPAGAGAPVPAGAGS